MSFFQSFYGDEFTLNFHNNKINPFEIFSGVMKETIPESSSVPTRVGSVPPIKVADQVKEPTKRSISQGNIKPTEEIIVKADLNSLLNHKVLNLFYRSIKKSFNIEYWTKNHGFIRDNLLF